jgi:hypothetical protein
VRANAFDEGARGGRRLAKRTRLKSSLGQPFRNDFGFIGPVGAPERRPIHGRPDPSRRLHRRLR